METYDIKREHRELYAPKRTPTQVDVPEFGFLMIDGHGDPNTAPSYAAAVEALYVLSYTIRAHAKRELGRVHTVGPLEGLWDAEDKSAFTSRAKSEWDWTMMILQPEWITAEIVELARSAAERKHVEALPRVRFERWTEGPCIQLLHIGSYDDETPVLAELHDHTIPELGLRMRGRHHEVYLSDPRKTEAAKLRTILRQPVEPIP